MNRDPVNMKNDMLKTLITKEELEEITLQKLGRLNQEGRDAALLAWDYAGLPMRITSATLRGQPSPKKPIFSRK